MLEKKQRQFWNPYVIPNKLIERFFFIFGLDFIFFGFKHEKIAFFQYFWNIK